MSVSWARAEVVNLVCTHGQYNSIFWIDLAHKTITRNGCADGSCPSLTGPVQITATTYRWQDFSAWEAEIDRVTGRMRKWVPGSRLPSGSTPPNTLYSQCSKGSAPMPKAKL